ncbi:MAG: rhamnulokinase [Chloroflexi bacterium]|nr:rhamnulokinase [Chloroflexota bacterium]
MSDERHVIAVDLGASSGRVLQASWDGERFRLRELHRFANGGLRVGQALYWDILGIWREVLAGLAQAVHETRGQIESIGLDSWAVDFGLLDDQDELLSNPHHYRDSRTNGMMAWVDQRVGRDALFQCTGIQFMPINSLYQLAALASSGSSQLKVARKFLMIPDLLNFWLTGEAVGEYTNATTTMCFDCRRRDWASDVLSRLGLSADIFPPVVQPGTVLGELLPSIRQELGLSASPRVVAPGTHDTASAVAAVPYLDGNSAYLSSGTWSLLGVETYDPVTSNEALRFNVTNEGGVAGTIRLLKNVTGLWLLQECQRQWQRHGLRAEWGDLLTWAASAPPLRSVVDPDAPDFTLPEDMPSAIQDFCQRTGQHPPEATGEIVRCCLDSLALKYRYVLEGLEALTGKHVEVLRVVGGGSQNALLCQLTADALQRPVVAGPVEATALGNVLVQCLSLGLLPSLATGRAAVARSFPVHTYEPHLHDAEEWNRAYQHFTKLIIAPTA